MIRTEVQLPISRFCELIELPRRIYHHRLAKHRAGEPAKGPWPAPVVDRIEPLVAKYAVDWDAWGHRKVWALARRDGHDVGSASSVRRAMGCRGLLQPVRYQAERRQLAQARRAAFVDPPERRNRVWQMDFSEFETTTGGIWRIGGVCDYWAKPALAGRVLLQRRRRQLAGPTDGRSSTPRGMDSHAWVRPHSAFMLIPGRRRVMVRNLTPPIPVSRRVCESARECHRHAL